MITKVNEENLLKYYLYFDEYVDDPKIKLNIKNKLMEMFSKKKGKSINKIDIFFLGHTINLGNNLIKLNNIIFYCEVIGCNKVLLKDHVLNRQWLLKNPVYIKKVNI